MTADPTPHTIVRRLYVLDYGLFQVHENDRIIGIQGFLIQTDDDQQILVDTGFPAAYADDAEAASRRDGLGSFGRVLQLDRENLPAGQLARVGLRPEAITMVIMTHTDVDHVGGLADFPGAPIVIGRAERALERPRYFENRTPMTWPVGVDYRLIDADVTLCPGVQILATPGHSPGHLSILLHLPETGAVLITGDAISRPAEVDEGYPVAWDSNVATSSATRLLATAERERAMIIYGHDPAQWPELRKAPAFYA